MAFKKIRETKVYRMAFELAMTIFEKSKAFPKNERYALTDQMCRSGRSVCACMAEAGGKRQYPAHFVLKISDADMENGETQTWLDFALHCGHLSTEEHHEFIDQSEQVGNMLNHMMKNPEKYL